MRDRTAELATVGEVLGSEIVRWRELIRRQAATQEDERRWVARDLQETRSVSFKQDWGWQSPRLVTLRRYQPVQTRG